VGVDHSAQTARLKREIGDSKSEPVAHARDALGVQSLPWEMSSVSRSRGGSRPALGLAFAATAVGAIAASAAPRVHLCTGQASGPLGGNVLSDSVIAGASVLTAVATIAMARFNRRLASLQQRTLDDQRADAGLRQYPAPVLAAIDLDGTGSIAKLSLQNPSQTPINLYGATIFGELEGACVFQRPLILLPGRSEKTKIHLLKGRSGLAKPRLAIYYSSGGRYDSSTIHVTLL